MEKEKCTISRLPGRPRFFNVRKAGLILTFLCCFGSGIAQEALRVYRYGKEITLEKDRSAKISGLTVYYENGAAYLSWNSRDISTGGVYVVMLSADGYDYSYSYLIPSVPQIKVHRYKLPAANKQFYCQVMYISNDNKYALSGPKCPASYYASNSKCH